MALKSKISKLLLISIIFQSCTVYQKQSILISDAVDIGKVKVVSKQDDTMILKNIYLKDSFYYGVHGKNHIQLYQHQISDTYPKDFKKSKKTTLIVSLSIIGIPILYVGILVFLFSVGVIGV